MRKQWTKLRNEYAADWPSSQTRPDTCQKKDQKNNATNQSEQTQVQNGHNCNNTRSQAANKEPDKSETTPSSQQVEGDRAEAERMSSGKKHPHTHKTKEDHHPTRIVSPSFEEQAKGKKYCCD